METPRTLAVEENDGLDELLTRIEPTMRSTICWFGIPRADGDDLLQQAFLTFLYKRDEIHNPEAWLLGTLRRRCLMYWRKRRREVVQHVDSAVLDLVASRSKPDQELADLRSDLNRVVHKLPDRCRSLLRLRYSGGLSPVEAAESLGYRSSGIYKIIDRCLSAFSRQLLACGFEERGEQGNGHAPH